jgi:hypothetical protein
MNSPAACSSVVAMMPRMAFDARCRAQSESETS